MPPPGHPQTEVVEQTVRETVSIINGKPRPAVAVRWKAATVDRGTFAVLTLRGMFAVLRPGGTASCSQGCQPLGKRISIIFS
jgi:hypothetical protein